MCNLDGWEGSIVVIAKNAEDARKLMQNAPNYDKDEPIEKHEIQEGFCFYNCGDL